MKRGRGLLASAIRRKRLYSATHRNDAMCQRRTSGRSRISFNCYRTMATI